MRTPLLIAVLATVACSDGRGVGEPDGSATVWDGGTTLTCEAGSPDQVGCTCTPPSMRGCYPKAFDAKTRGVGLCKDGTQRCAGAGEFSSYGDCTGAVVPVPENCGDQLDNNCDGNVDCADPSCATDPACNTGCTDGQTRVCYTGPTGTLGVGTCAGGMQVCVGGNWPTTCPGEVTPMPENCSDAQDHDCNHLPGCLDFFSCLLAPACQEACDSKLLDPSCVCPMGAGDTATCPNGMFGTVKGGSLTSPGNSECCPCSAADCGNPACCGEAVCAGNPQCAGLTCKPLPVSCNNRVNADCDDFPEDCDEPCCKCTDCP